MGSFTTISISILLLLTLQLQGRTKANPVSNNDLVDFKNLLDRLEDKIPLEDEVMASQGLNEQNEEAEEALSPLSSWSEEVSPAQREAAFNRGTWEQSERSALLKNKLRALLTSPRSLRRSSSCFGGRIDRIGAQSGLGCNSFRVRRYENGIRRKEVL
ncbi:natriuretic peptides A [Phascolarctos cinereus]|uniref:Natriuretic peptides A n=1 Tax=Phascolarctos cinereus TaxID=38626 RepID=A0A6P5J9B6_PHACI|nr:natriuretic peptides A isoform X1 [Phascolarctos cinereus]